jgi:hypothetical protein
MNLDSLKRGYNDHKKTDKKFFTSEEFTKNFDEKGFSIWQSSHVDNDCFTNKPDFIQRNIVNGYIQGLDFARKYAFGAMLLLSESETKFKLVGYWILRGNEPLPEVFGEFQGSNTWEKLVFSQETCKIFDSFFYDETFCNMNVEHRALLL